MSAPPREFARPGYVMRMKKAAYGFADAPRRWFLSQDKTLKDLGFKASKVDPAVYYFPRASNDKTPGHHGILCLHVDDGLCLGDDVFRQKLGGYFAKYQVNADKGEQGTFEFTGAEVSKTAASTFELSQQVYAGMADPVKLAPGRAQTPEADLDDVERSQLRQVIGVCGWPAVISRPDLAVETSLLQSSMKKPTVSDLKLGNKLIKRMKANSDLKLRYIDVAQGGSTALLMFSDAALQNVKDENADSTQSQAGWICVEVGTKPDGSFSETPQFNVIAWSSRKIRRTARSSFAAETLAAVDAADNLVHLNFLRTELSGRTGAAHLLTDSMNLKDHVAKKANSTTEKRLKTDLYSLKESVATGELTLLWVDGDQNIADGFTKSAPAAQKVLELALRSGRLPITNVSA